MVCVHGTGELLASPARQGYSVWAILRALHWQVASASYPCTLCGSVLFSLHHLNVLLTPHGSVSTLPVPGRTRELSGLLSEHFTLHRTQAMCAAHPQLTGGIHLFQTCQQFSKLPAQERHFRTAVFLFYSSKEAKPSLDGDVKVLLQCFEQQMVPSVQAEKSGMNRREEVLTTLVTLSIPAGMPVTKETTKVKKQPPPAEGPIPGEKLWHWDFSLCCGCTSANERSGSCLLHLHQKNPTG